MSYYMLQVQKIGYCVLYSMRNTVSLHEIQEICYLNVHAWGWQDTAEKTI